MTELDTTYVVRDSIVMEKLFAFIRGNAKAMAEAGHPMVCHLMAENAKRSLDQNRRLWALLQEIADSAWVSGRQYSKDSWAEAFRHKFLPKIDGPDGSYPVSTTSLNVKQFSQYLEQIQAYAAAAGSSPVCCPYRQVCVLRASASGPSSVSDLGCVGGCGIDARSVRGGDRVHPRPG